MRTNLIFLFLLFSLEAVAQQPDTAASNRSRFYVGVSFSTVSHHIYYKNPKGAQEVTSGYFAPLAINFGYQLNERASVQAGLAYGGSSDHNNWSPGSPDTLMYDSYSNTHVLAVPVTMRYVLFKVFRRFQLYGTGTIMPAFGTTKFKRIETRQDDISTVLDVRDTGMNTFVTAGLGLNYKISKRFSGIIEYHGFKYNLTGNNSFYYDWDQGFTGFLRISKSVGVGFNYSL